MAFGILKAPLHSAWRHSLISSIAQLSISIKFRSDVCNIFQLTLTVVILSVDTLNVIMLCVVGLSAAAPHLHH